MKPGDDEVLRDLAHDDHRLAEDDAHFVGLREVGRAERTGSKFASSL